MAPLSMTLSNLQVRFQGHESQYYSKTTNSKMVHDRAIITMAD